MIKTYDITKKIQYQAAGPRDLIAMKPVKGNNQLFIPKYILEIMVYGIVHQKFIHVSGPTGSAKSSLIEALSREPENFRLLCSYLEYHYKPIEIFEIEMALFDTPAELFLRRSLNESGTYDEDSVLVTAMKKSVKHWEVCYPCIFLKEMGRVHTAAIQGGLLNLMTKSDLRLPPDVVIPGGHICFICDSNYSAAEDAQHTLVLLDDALKRRFSINVLLDYLSSKEERAVLQHLLLNKYPSDELDLPLIKRIVHLGHAIRQYKAEGNLISVVAPTIYGYETCYEMAKALPHVSIEEILTNSMLGIASRDDMRTIRTLIQDVFHVQEYAQKDSVFNNVF